LPENFTLEFDMVATGDLSEMEGGLGVVFLDKSERKLSFDVFNMTTQVGLDIHPFAENGESKIWVVNQNSEELMRNNIKIDWNTNRVNRISFWRQKTRLRMYINQTKVWDIPRAFMPGINYSFLFNTNLWSGSLLLSNLKLAIGLPDTRNKLVTEGKFVTHGILFDVNSDVIKPESAGVLKEIATVLQENPGIKINVIGHTDSDGNTAANMLLSKRRADAVRNTLAKNYGIASDRMQAEGKGASVPIDSNQSIQGKTNNRRVEFVKIN
jgi:outer membrane protein OmpA-like peptidoglycan-associated protein